MTQLGRNTDLHGLYGSARIKIIRENPCASVSSVFCVVLFFIPARKGRKDEFCINCLFFNYIFTCMGAMLLDCGFYNLIAFSDFRNHVHALNNLTEDSIIFVKELRILKTDIKLRGGTVGVLRPCHAHGAFFVR